MREKVWLISSFFYILAFVGSESNWPSDTAGAPLVVGIILTLIATFWTDFT